MRIFITLLLFGWLSHFGVTQTLTTRTQHQYLHSDIGLENQFRDILDAYKTDSTSLSFQLSSLKIDDEWFTQNFLQGDAERLSPRYREMFEKYVEGITRNLQRYDHSKELTITAVRVIETPCAIVAQASVFPSRVVVAEPFKFVYRSKGQGRTEWVSTFVYVNGRFRLLGEGILPFWIAPGPVQVSRTPPKGPTQYCSISEVYDPLRLEHWR